MYKTILAGGDAYSRTVYKGKCFPQGFAKLGEDLPVVCQRAAVSAVAVDGTG